LQQRVERARNYEFINMTMNWPKQSDDELIAEAQTGSRGQGAVVEAMRRLRSSIDALRQSFDYYATWMMALTIVLAILTALLVYKEFR
jgi:hypothetical protein